jgi:hypothetical protein
MAVLCSGEDRLRGMRGNVGGRCQRAGQGVRSVLGKGGLEGGKLVKISGEILEGWGCSSDVWEISVGIPMDLTEIPGGSNLGFQMVPGRFPGQCRCVGAIRTPTCRLGWYPSAG